MSQVTLYLDESTEEILEESAQASGLSKSRWVVELIRAHARREWPADFLGLAGAFADFPFRADGPDVALDVPRIEF
jgi:hypothetical protein